MGIKIKGANAAAFNSTEPELILSGPAGCGKTFAALHKLQDLAFAFEDLRIAMVRKTRVSMNNSTLETFENEVYPPQYLQRNQLDRKSRTKYIYPNGSEIHVMGLDDPNKLLSSRWDIIYINECTELTEEEWGVVGSRLLRHGMPFNQLFGDCNPPRIGKLHWIWKRFQRGDTPIYFADHSLNPTITADDIKRLASLRGDLKRRFHDGSWDAIPEDGLFQAGWFKYIKAKPTFGKWARGWDIGAGATKQSDESAGGLVGLCPGVDGNPGAIVIADITSGHWGPDERNAQMRLCAQMDSLIEAKGYFEKGFGIGTDMTLSVLKACSGYSMWAVKPKGSKLFRADPLAGQCQAGNVYLVEADWNSAFVIECCGFTGEEGGIDNKVDAVSLAFNQLTR